MADRVEMVDLQMPVSLAAGDHEAAITFAQGGPEPSRNGPPTTDA